jgi:hypothetical protein
MTTNPDNSPFTLEESVNFINVHIQGKNRWGLFIISALPLVVFTPLMIAFIVLCVGMVISGFGELIFKGQTDPESLWPVLWSPVILLALAGVTFGLYTRWHAALALIPGHEVLEIDERSLSITRSYPFRHTRRIPAGEILGICHSGLFLRGPLARTTWLVTPFSNGLWVWRTGRFGFIPITICTGLHSVRANTILGRIHDRYPQYKFNQTIDDPLKK